MIQHFILLEKFDQKSRFYYIKIRTENRFLAFLKTGFRFPKNRPVYPKTGFLKNRFLIPTQNPLKATLTYHRRELQLIVLAVELLVQPVAIIACPAQKSVCLSPVIPVLKIGKKIRKFLSNLVKLIDFSYVKVVFCLW